MALSPCCTLIFDLSRIPGFAGIPNRSSTFEFTDFTATPGFTRLPGCSRISGRSGFPCTSRIFGFTALPSP